MRLDLARRRERQRDWEGFYCTPTKRNRTCEATPIGLRRRAEGTLFGRETSRNLSIAPRHVDASRNTLPGHLFFLVSLSYAPCVLIKLNFLRTSSVGGGGGGGGCCQTFYFCSFSPVVDLDHERDWPRVKLLFSGWPPIHRL